MSTISRRIETAIKHLKEKDYENALIQISIAIDATAKKKWNDLSVGKRIMNFVREYEWFIYRIASSNCLIMGSNAHIIIAGKELPQIIYKLVRCTLQHGDDLSEYIIIKEQSNILGMQDDKIIINIGHIFGLLFAVIFDPVNKNEICKDNNDYLTFNNHSIPLNKLWGDMNNFNEFYY